MKGAEVYPSESFSDWNTVMEDLDREGYAVLRNLIHENEVQALGAVIHSDSALSAWSLFGPSASIIAAPQVEYSHSLPTELVERLLVLQPRLASIADRWAALSEGKIDHVKQGTLESNPVIIRTMFSSHGAGEHQSLHQFVD